MRFLAIVAVLALCSVGNAQTCSPQGCSVPTGGFYVTVHPGTPPPSYPGYVRVQVQVPVAACSQPSYRTSVRVRVLSRPILRCPLFSRLFSGGCR